MKKACKGLFSIKSLKNSHLSLAIGIVLLTSFGASAQYDSTNTRQRQSSYGFDWRNGRILNSFILPRDTLHLAVKDSNAIAIVAARIWKYNGYHWQLSTAGSVVSPAAGLDSLSWHNNVLCAWGNGSDTCFDLSKGLAYFLPNFDYTKYIEYNLNNEILDSTDNNYTVGEAGPGILLTKRGSPPHDTLRISATGVDGSVLFGGIVSHDTLYKYDATAAIFSAGTGLYNSAAGSTTLDPSDPDHDRIDLLILDTLTGFGNKAGSPAANPQEPQIDPLKQKILTRVIVKAGTTTPDLLTHLIVYDQLTEPFTPSVSAGVASTNFTNTTNPYHLTRSADVPAWSSVGYMQFGGVNYNTYDVGLINFHIKLKAAMTSAGNIIVRFYNIATGVSSAVTVGPAHGFDKASTAYQNVTIPATALAFSGTKYTTVAFTFVGTGPGCYLDYIQIQGGIANGVAQYGPVYKKANTDSIFQNIFGSPVFVYRDSAGGGATITASNGTRRTGNNIEIGGEPLIRDDSLMTSGHTLFVTGTSTFGHPLINILDSGSSTGLNVEGGTFPIHGKTADGTGVWGEATGTGSGLFGTANSGYGLNGTSVSSAGVRAYSTGASGAGRFELQRTSNNSVEAVLQIRRTTTGSPVDGIGSSIDFYGQRLFGAPTIANQIKSRWTDITNVTSEVDITGMNAASDEFFARFKPLSIVIIGNGADTVATLRDLRSFGGTGLTGVMLYTDSASMLSSYKSAIDAHTLSLIGKQATLVSGTNIKTVAGVSLVGSGDVPASTILKDSSSVTFYGAVPDGVTDCTAAIQLALNSHKNIYFPSGTYITSNLTINSGQRISGYDSTSILQFKTGSTGFMLEAGGNSFTMENISLFGGNSSSYKNTTTSAANRSALHLNTLTNGTLIANNSIYGFDSTGIALSGASTPTFSPAVVIDNNFYNNFIAINMARDTSFPGEYCRINNNSFHDNRTAIIKIAGNTIFNSNVVVYNGYGVQLLQNNNGGHGNIQGNEINHNTVYGIYAKKVILGEAIIGNQLFFNDIMIDSCSNINIQGNTIAGFSDGLATLTVTFRGGNTNYFKGNFTRGVILTRSNDNTIVSDNYKEAAGTFLGNYKDVIESSGKVGIGLGATAPAYALDVLESVNGASYLHLKNSSSGNSATAGIQLNNNGTDAAFLSLYGTGTGTPGTTFLSGTRSFVFLSDANTASGGTGKIQFATSGYNNVATPNFTMDPNGRFGIGQVSPTEKLEVAGNILMNTAGNKLKITTGTNASVGTSTLVAGTVTVSTTAAATASKIFVTVVTPGGTQGFLSVPTIVNGTSFTINSTSASETSTVNWWIIN